MNKRFQALAELYKAGKVAEKKVAALKAADTPRPPVPPGAPPPPTSPDGPFVDSDATAAFIIAANERRLAGCPPEPPTDPTARFICETIEKLKVRT